MTVSPSPPPHDDAVRLVTAVIAKGAGSELVHDIAEQGVQETGPVELAVEVAEIAAGSLEALAVAEGEDSETLLRMIAERRDPPSEY
ncbi:MAG: hypothetical protein JWP66_1895 [Naasia sp.]|nr:hypothetical protein [Naasia sp.]